MFDNAFSALKGLLSRSFIVGAFLPVFIAVAINGLLIALANKGLQDTIEYLRETLKIADVATAIGVGTLIAIPLAFTLSPLLVGFRLLLEGEWLMPRYMRNDLIKAARKRADELKASVDAGQEYVEDYSKQQDQAASSLRQAASPWLNAEKEADRKSYILKPELIETAEGAIVEFRRAINTLAVADTKKYGRLSEDTLDRFSKAYLALHEALPANSSPPPNVVPNDQEGWAERLSEAYSDFFVLMAEGRDDARREASRRISKRDGLLVANDPRPTRLGNLRAQIEDYSQAVYGIGFDYLWPRLRMSIEHDENKFEPVEQAETQLNFALMLLLLVAIGSSGWLIHLLLTSDDPILLALVGVLVPVLNFVFYLVVVESQRVLIGTTKATIDRFRFSLLRALWAPAPTSYQNEREIWGQLQAMSYGLMKGQEFNYKPPPEP